MSRKDIAEPEFVRHREEAAVALYESHRRISKIRAYVLAECELGEFKDIHLNLRKLTNEFEEYLPEDYERKGDRQ